MDAKNKVIYLSLVLGYWVILVQFHFTSSVAWKLTASLLSMYILERGSTYCDGGKRIVYIRSFYSLTWILHMATRFYLSPYWPETLVMFDHIYVKVWRHSGLKIDQGIQVKLINPDFRVKLTRSGLMAYWPVSVSRFDPLRVKFDQDVFRVYYIRIDCTFQSC